MKTSKYDKSRVMKRAWAILKKEGAQNITWSDCLIQSWNIEKNGTNKITFEWIYNEFYSQVLTYIKSRINNCTEIAEELCQDVFLQVNKHVENYDVNKAKVKTWLYTMAKNKVIDWFRANKHSHNISHVDGWTDDEGRETFQFEGSYNVENVESKETNVQIMTAIATLNEKEQAIAVMYFVDDKEYKEISELLDIPMGSVKGTLSRIRAKLQEKLQDVYASL